MTVAPPPSMTPPRPALAAAYAQKKAPISEEYIEAMAFRRLKRRVVLQTWLLAGLAVLLMLLLPFAMPISVYFAMTPEKKVKMLSGLSIPNMTNHAVLSWSTTSITEVMTMGFGDLETRLPLQRVRFTEKGWDAYMETFKVMKIRESFKQNQLVLTTVPSNTPVIIGQGTNQDGAYQWNVQMPIIMNYATNNNVMRRQRAMVTLSVVRVPLEENSFGIAIRSWSLE